MMDEVSLRMTVLWLVLWLDLIRIWLKWLKFFRVILSDPYFQVRTIPGEINSFVVIIDTYLKFNDRLQLGQGRLLSDNVEFWKTANFN